MDHEFNPPSNEIDFERFCLGLLKVHWPDSNPQRWGRRGQKQDGVDIVDMNAAEPLRAAQCKFKKRGGVLKPSEVVGEIEAAKSFDMAGLKIGRYTILTTSENDTELQAEVIKANRAHGKTGLFTVDLLTWEAIEEILRGYPGLWETLIGSSLKALIEPLEHQIATLSQQFLTVSVTPDSTANAAYGDELDRRLEAARAHLEAHEYEAAALLLKNLESTHLGKMSPPQKFLRLTYRAKAELSLGDWRAAGKLFIDARQHLPEDERAITNYALGLELLGRNAEANAVARDATERFPGATRPWAIAVRTAEPLVSVQTLAARLPSAAAEDNETLVALAMRALHEHKWEEAATYAGKAARPNTNWAAPFLLLGQAKLQIAVTSAYKTVESVAVADGSGPLSEATEALDEAVAHAEAERNRYLLINALIERARANAARGDDEGQRRDIQRAYQVGQDDPFALRHYGEFLLLSGNIDLAVDILRECVRFGGAPDATFLLAAALREQAADGRNCDWLPLMIDAAADASSAHAYQAFSAALDGLLCEDHSDRAKALVARVAESGLAEPAVRAGEARFAMSGGNRPEALKLALTAASLCVPVTPVACVRFVALTLDRLGSPKRAVRLWTRVAAETRQINDAWSLVGAAKRAGRHDIILNVAREWRDAGVRDERLVEAELQYLERHEPRRAVEVLQGELSREPDSPFLLLRLSMLGARLDRPDLICTDLRRLPSPKEAGAHNGLAVVQLIADKGDRFDGVRYAYRLLRLHPQSEKAHRAFLLAMLSHPPELSHRLLTVPETIGPGLAVRVREQGAEAATWHVIEDESDSGGFGDETPFNHAFAARLIGRRKGDTFPLDEDVLGSPKVTIEDVLSKYVYRFQRVLEDWHVRFPESKGFRKFRIEGVGEKDGLPPNFLPLIHQLHQEQRRADELMELYRSGPKMSLHMLAEQIGRNEIETQLILSFDEQGPVACYVGPPDGQEHAFQVASTAKAYILGLSALTTLATLRRSELVRDWPIPVLVSSHTAVALDDFLKRWKRNRGGSRIMATSHGLGFQFLKGDAASDELFLQPFEELRRVLDSREAIQDCSELASARPTARKQLTQILGLHGAETVALAARPGHVLWTDDFAAAIFGQHFFAVRSCWTQIVLFEAVRRGMMDDGAYQEASATLMGYNYMPIKFDVGTLRAACRLSDWHIRAMPLRQCLTALGNPAGIERNKLVAAHFFRSLFGEHVAHIRGDEVALAVLDSLAKASGGDDIASELRAALPMLFRFDIPAEVAARDVIDNWLSIRRST